VANGPATFNSNKIKFALINRTGKVKQYSEQTKEQAADVILDQVAALS
jgi:hypothetical protein